MTYRTAPATARPASLVLAAIANTRFSNLARAATVAVAFAFAMGSPAFAQQPPAPAPAPTAKSKPKKPAQQAAPPAAAEPQPAPAPAGQAPNGQQVQLVFSPWTKFCLKGQPGQAPDPNAKEVCFTGKDARVESGQPVAAAVIIEPEGQEKKLLRITLPLGMQLVHGTRVIIDQNQPMTAPYVICFTNGCMADYEVNAEMIGKL